jgi:hypothetical protein
MRAAVAALPLARLDAARDALAGAGLAFVGGQGKSGTTWVERLLDSHPDAACLGEGHFAAGLGRRLYAALEEYNRLVVSNNARFAELEDFPAMDGEAMADLVRVALMLQFAQIAQRRPGARVVAVRTPSELDWLRQLAQLVPNAVFVHVLRDPRDVAVSLWFHGERLARGSMVREHGTPARLATRLVPGWARHVLNVRQAAADASARLHEVRYERLIQDGPVEAAALFEALGLDSSDARVAQALEACRFEKLSGGRQPGQSDAGSHFRSGTAGGWSSHMPAAPEGGWPVDVAELLDSLGYATR